MSTLFAWLSLMYVQGAGEADHGASGPIGDTTRSERREAGMKVFEHQGKTYLGDSAGFQYLQKRYCPSALTK